MRYEFGSTGERDAFIGREFPERAGDENVPGLYRLPDGRELSVFCNVVTVDDAPAPRMSADFGAISFPRGAEAAVGRFPDGSPNPYEFGC